MYYISQLLLSGTILERFRHILGTQIKDLGNRGK